MWKVLILQASHSLSDERTEFLIKDRLSFMRFLGLGLGDPVPDANTIWTFREALSRARIKGKPAIEVMFRAYEAALTRAGFLAMGGQIIDASIVAAPKQRNTDGEKAEIKAGRIPDGWKDKPAKLAQKDRDARWTVKFSKAKPSGDGSPHIDLAVPAFGYKSHIGTRPTSRPDPDLGRDGRGASRGGATAEPGLQGEHREQRVGGHGTDPRPTRSTSPTTGFARKSIARSRLAALCRRTSPVRTEPSQRSEPRSSTSLPARKALWVSSSAPSKSASPNIVYNMRRAVWLVEHPIARV